MTKKTNRAFDRNFYPHKNSSICYVHIEEIETPVKIDRISEKITLNLVYRGKLFNSEEIIITGNSDYLSFNISRIKFPDLRLNEIDLRNLASCIDRMVDFIYD